MYFILSVKKKVKIDFFFRNDVFLRLYNRALIKRGLIMLLIHDKKNPIRGLFFVSLILSCVVLLATATSYMHYAITLPLVLYTPFLFSFMLIPLNKETTDTQTTYRYLRLTLLTIKKYEQKQPTE